MNVLTCLQHVMVNSLWLRSIGRRRNRRRGRKKRRRRKRRRTNYLSLVGVTGNGMWYRVVVLKL